MPECGGCIVADYLPYHSLDIGIDFTDRKGLNLPTNGPATFKGDNSTVDIW